MSHEQSRLQPSSMADEPPAKRRYQPDRNRTYIPVPVRGKVSTEPRVFIVVVAVQLALISDWILELLG